MNKLSLDDWWATCLTPECKRDILAYYDIDLQWFETCLIAAELKYISDETDLTIKSFHCAPTDPVMKFLLTLHNRNGALIFSHTLYRTRTK